MGGESYFPPLATFVPYRKSCARGQGRQPSNPHSSSPLHRCSFPLIAVSSLGAFRTPAAVRVEPFVTAGIRKPSHERTSSIPEGRRGERPLSFAESAFFPNFPRAAEVV